MGWGTERLAAGSRCAENLQIVPVVSRRDRRRFLRLPWSIYGHEPAWIPPLLIEQRQHISAGNPYFQHARWKAWLAFRDGVPIGRISAQVDQLHLDHHADATGFFGMLEAIDDPQVYTALLGTGEQWLRAQDLQRVLGPFNLSINQECGLLIDGFDSPPMVLMGHALPYCASHIEAAGYEPVKDLLAYRIAADFAIPPAMQSLVGKSHASVRLRALQRSRLEADFAVLRDIFNDAWSENWGFVPFTPAEFRRMGRELAPWIRDDFVQIAELQGEPVGMIVLLPNINEAIRDLNGRLLPLGWAKLLWRLKHTGTRTARIPLMGIRKPHQQTLLGTALSFMLIAALRGPARRHGIETVELSWILEDNLPMRNIIESLGGVAYKRYRIYGKALGNPPAGP
jgi:hypothetical protein